MEIRVQKKKCDEQTHEMGDRFLPHVPTWGVLRKISQKIILWIISELQTFLKNNSRNACTEPKSAILLHSLSGRNATPNESEDIKQAPRERVRRQKIEIFESICNLRGRTGHKLIYVHTRGSKKRKI